MEDDFLDVSVAQPEQRPSVSELLRKLVAFAVVNVLEMHPNKTSMAPSIVFKREGNTHFFLESDINDYGSVDAVVAAARSRLLGDKGGVGDEGGLIEGYVLLMDSAENTPGFPAARPLDESGNAFPPDTPAMCILMGERSRREGIMVIQPYRKRFIRGGATPMGAPLILPGPDSLLWDVCEPDTEPGLDGGKTGQNATAELDSERAEPEAGKTGA